MGMVEADLDFGLVPAGILMMAAYHLWLLRRIVKYPKATVLGVNAINRRLWVRAMMEDPKNGILAVQTLRNNIMASTVLASTAIMLGSLIAVLMSGDATGAKTSSFIVGSKSQTGFSIKFFSVFICFLVAFLMNVQSIRYYSHASILINVPYKKISSDQQQHHLTAEYVAGIVNKGNYFWSMGLHAFYFSFPLFLWIFGPIPMFVCCCFLVCLLYFLDTTFECTWATDSPVASSYQRDEELGGN